MTNQRRALRAAAVVVAMAATAATASTFATAQAHDTTSGSAASSVDRRDPASAKGHVEHNLEGPFSEQQAAQREAALEQVLSGDKKVTTRSGSKVVKLGDKKYVELGREKTDKIFTILLEFGDQVDDTTLFDPDGDGPKPPVKKFGGTPARRTTRSPSRTRRRTTAPPGRPTTTRRTSRSCTSARARTSTRSRPITRRPPRAGTRSTARSPTG